MLNYQNDSNIRLIKNNTGADVGQYQILKLDGPVFTPTDNATGWLQRQTFKGVTPTADCDFAITQRAVPNGKTQPAIFAGVTPCTINVTDAAHTHAVAGTTAAKLVSATSGPAKILWKESGTGDKNAFVMLGQSESISDEYCSFAPRRTWDDTGFSGAVGQVAYNTSTNWPIQVPRFISSAYSKPANTIFETENSTGIGVQTGRIFIKQSGVFDLYVMGVIKQQASLIESMKLLDEDGVTTRFAAQYYAPSVSSVFSLMADNCSGLSDGKPVTVSGVNNKIYTSMDFPNIPFPYLNTNTFSTYFCHSTSFSLSQSNIDQLGGRIELNHLITVGSSNTPSISGAVEINWATGSSGIIAYRGSGESRNISVPTCNGGVNPV